MAEARQADAVGKSVRLQGWIRTRRDSKGGFSFLELNDGSSLGNIQIIAEAALPNYESEIKHLSAGCSVTVDGEVKASPAKGQATEVHATQRRGPRLGRSRDVSAAEEAALVRVPADARPTCGRGPTRSAPSPACAIASAARSTISSRKRAFSTSTRRSSRPATAKGPARCSRSRRSTWPRCPSSGRRVDYAQDFFDRPAFLTVSGQLEAEIFACSLGKVYTFGPTFRAENSNTSRHLAEFWMVEPEMAFFELTDNMDLAERFLKRIFRDVLAQCPEDMQFFNEHDRHDGDRRRSKRSSPASSSGCRTPRRSTFSKRSGETFEFPVAWGHDLQAEHERYLTEQNFKKPGDPVRLSAHDQAVLHARQRRRPHGAGDGRAGAQGRRDHRRQPARGAARRARTRGCASRSSTRPSYWWYLDLRRYGTVPHSGFGLGLERAVQFVTGMANIRDVIPFPRTPGSATFNVCGPLQPRCEKLSTKVSKVVSAPTSISDSSSVRLSDIGVFSRSNVGQAGHAGRRIRRSACSNGSICRLQRLSRDRGDYFSALRPDYNPVFTSFP